MDSSPAQRMFGRRMKTLLPTSNRLLQPETQKGVTGFTFCYEVGNVFVHAWPINDLTSSPEAALDTCMGSMKFFTNLFLRKDVGMIALGPVDTMPSWVASSSMQVHWN